MADPLSDIANEFAPAPTSYFDRGQAQSLIARYSNANRESESSKSLADAASARQRLQASVSSEQRAADKAARDSVLATRADKEYEDKKLTEESRGGFLQEFAETMDPTSPDYTKNMTSFMAKLPPYMQTDEGLKGIITVFNRQAESAETERERVSLLGEQQKNRMAILKERAMSDDTLKFLKPEDLANPPLGEDGQVDPMRLGMLAKQRELESNLVQDKAKVGNRKEAAIELKNVSNMNNVEKARFKETKDIVITNTEAFPSKVEMLRKKHSVGGKAAPDETLEFKDPEGFAAAKTWDKNKFAKEVDTAMDIENVEDYVDMVPKISDAARERRLRIWDYAHQNDGKEPAGSVTETVTETETVTPTAAAPAAPAPTAAAPTAAAPTAAVRGVITDPKDRKPLTQADLDNAVGVIKGNMIQFTIGGRVFRRPATTEELNQKR